MNWFERGWYQQHKGTLLLLPLSGVFWLLSTLRRTLFKLGVKQSIELDKPVIVVGNITVGGTGKTPFVIWLVEHLRSKGWNPGVITRGYGGQVKTEVHIVQPQDRASFIGDEVKLIFNRTQVPIAVSSQRANAAKALIEKCHCDIIISDDGLQHYQLNRDVEIILIDGSRQLGNQFLLPAGPLREGLWRLNTSDLVIQNGQSSQASFTPHMFTTQISEPKPVVGTDSYQMFDYSATYHSVCAIGNPQRFFDSLSQKNIKIASESVFLDHYQYTQSDFGQFEQEIIMTEKDAVKCMDFAQKGWWYLPISIQPDLLFIDKLDKKLNSLR